MQCQTHSGGNAILQTRPLQQADARCPFHCCPGYHYWESHAGPLWYLRWTDTAGSNMPVDIIVQSLCGMPLQFECIIQNIEVSLIFCSILINNIISKV